MGLFLKKGLFTAYLNAEGIVKIYKKALLPSNKKWFKTLKDQWILQEDNNPEHQSTTARKNENTI